MPDQGTPDRDAHELTVMTDAALGMLLDGGEIDRSILDAPPSVLRRLIVDEARNVGLSEADVAILADGATASPQAPGVAKVVLTELRRAKPIRDELDAATARREELMVIDPISIAAAALLVTVLEVRRIKISKSGAWTCRRPCRVRGREGGTGVPEERRVKSFGGPYRWPRRSCSLPAATTRSPSYGPRKGWIGARSTTWSNSFRPRRRELVQVAGAPGTYRGSDYRCPRSPVRWPDAFDLYRRRSGDLCEMDRGQEAGRR